jgi:hypothetical protein
MEQKRTKADKPASEESASTWKKCDELLDEALEETFPASDPVAISQPVHTDEDWRR